MGIVLVIAVIIFAIFGGVSFFVYKKIVQSAEESITDKSTDPNITTTQDFLPFKDIKNNAIDLGEHSYVGILECTSTNYFLRTEEEQQRIDMTFTRFLNSLTHRIVIYIQTREMDYSKFLSRLSKDIEEVANNNDKLARVADEYYNSMVNLSDRIGNTKQKKKYILVPFAEAHELEKLSDSEKREYSLTELRTRMNIVASGLSPVGVIAKPLDTREIIELIYSSYNRDFYAPHEDITNGKHLTMVVDGKNPLDEMSDEELIDLIIFEAQEKLRKELPTHKIVGEGAEYENILYLLNEIRENIDKERKHDKENADRNQKIKKGGDFDELFG